MGLAGNLEDLALSDIIQIIHLSRKTGILTLIQKDKRGAILFKNGLIVQAYSPVLKESLLKMLVKDGSLSQHHIEQAIKKQKSDFVHLNLVSILIRQEHLSETKVLAYVRHRTLLAITDLLDWVEGKFNFEIDKSNLEHFAPSCKDEIPLKQGMTPQTVFMESTGAADAPSSASEPPSLKNRRQRTTPIAVSGDFVSSEQQKKAPQRQVKTVEREQTSGVSSTVEREDISQAPTTAVPQTPLQPSHSLGNAPITQKTDTQKTITIIVDDERVMLDLITKKVRTKGFEVYGFMDLPSMYAKVTDLDSKGLIPVIVLDLVIPVDNVRDSDGLGGLIALEEMTRKHPEVPVIVMSDLMDPSVRYQAYEKGARNYLYKPDRSKLKISELTKEINRFGEELALCILNIAKERERLKKQTVGSSAKPSTTPRLGAASEEDIEEELKKMKQIFYELQNPKETSEVILLVLRLASEHLERGILFLKSQSFFTGIGGFGTALSGEPIVGKITSLNLSLSEHSLFRELLETKKMFLGIPNKTAVHDYLYSIIGRPLNESVVAIPLMSEGRIIAVFYGDNGTRMRPIENILGLEIFINQAGIALENALLQKRLKGRLI